jgi:two-component system NtrC family sensor kinase
MPELRHAKADASGPQAAIEILRDPPERTFEMPAWRALTRPPSIGVLATGGSERRDAAESKTSFGISGYLSLRLFRGPQRPASAGTFPYSSRPLRVDAPERVVRQSPPVPSDLRDAARRRRLLQELSIRVGVSVIVLIFNDLGLVDTGANRAVRVVAILGIFLNGPYFVAAATNRWLRPQAYARLLLDVLLTTAGLYGAGGLGAAQYLGVYSILPVYSAIAFSSLACMLATGVATLSYGAVVAAQELRILPLTRPPIPQVGVVVAFNLLILNIIGALAAVLAGAYRRSQRRLSAVNAELERAHDESLRLNTHLQRSARLEALGEVVAGVVHEVRNAIQVALGNVWFAQQKARHLPDLGRHLDQVAQSCEDALRIVKNSLVVARQPSAEPTCISVSEAVQRVAELKSYDLRRMGILLRVDVSPDLPPVLGAPFQLEQVLLNLITNAQDGLRNAPEPRLITVTARHELESLILEVHDSGPGIPAAVLVHLFEPFYTTKPDGTGLGLPISAGIIRDFGGELTGGNHPAGGACFRIRLPSYALRDMVAGQGSDTTSGRPTTTPR